MGRRVGVRRRLKKRAAVAFNGCVLVAEDNGGGVDTRSRANVLDDWQRAGRTVNGKPPPMTMLLVAAAAADTCWTRRPDSAPEAVSQSRVAFLSFKHDRVNNAVFRSIVIRLPLYETVVRMIKGRRNNRKNPTKGAENKKPLRTCVRGRA